jgi:hypothetical protein
MMRKFTAVLLPIALLGSCGKEDAKTQAAEDASDVAMVKRMSREPFKPINPDPIGPTDVARYGLDKPGCFFRKGDDDHADPIFFGDDTDGFMRLGGDLKRFAAKTLSAQLPGGARTTYTGLASWLDIMRLPDAGTGADAYKWPARLILHDSQERVAFMADGIVTCRE